MEKQQLFLIGSGRSGTTLIQRVINTLPNTMIWGEHGGFLKQISELYYFLKDDSSMHEYSYNQNVDVDNKFDLEAYNDSKIWQAWINWFRPEDLDDIFRDFIERIFCPEKFTNLKIWGFKEIRYGADDRVISLLAHLYPNANFIFITRDSLNAIESQMTTFFKGKSKYTRLKRLINLPRLLDIAKNWKNQNAYLKLTKQNPSTHYLIRYEDALADLEVLNSIIGKYGLKIGKAQLEVLTMKEGRGTNYKLNNSVHLRWRRMGFIPAFFAEIFVGSVSLDLGYKRPDSLKLATRISILLQMNAN